MQAGDMWGQYLAAQKKREEAQHASAAQQMHASRSAQSRPPMKGAEPPKHDHRRVSSTSISAIPSRRAYV